MLTDIFSLLSVTSEQQSDTIDVSTTYPLPSLKTNVGALHFPYFRFSLPGNTAVYEWQIHPLDHGTLRYTLAELEDETSSRIDAAEGQDVNIKAIYHHVGYHGSLFLQQSEGVLLLPELDRETDNGLLESVIVSSLVGLLWRIRGMEIKENEPKDGVKKRRSLMKRMFGRKE